FTNWRGVEAIGTVWSILDRTSLGRQEEWEDTPEGRPRGLAEAGSPAEKPALVWWGRTGDNHACPPTAAPGRKEPPMSALAQAQIDHPRRRAVPRTTSPETVRSGDGTAIAFERRGQGPPLILVDGALCDRAMGPSTPLARLLAEHFTVFTYDRRGRGESDDTKPYAVQREIEDLQALIDAAGGSVFMWGISSGAVLALEAAREGSEVSKLALYEPPFIVDDSRPRV